MDQQEVTSTNTEAQESKGTPSEVTESTLETKSNNVVEDASASVDSTSTEAPVQEWKPSYKYKVLDKELEFDEPIKKAVTTKEAEEKIKELYEKASGLDEVKTKRDKFQTERDEWKGKFSQVETSLKALGERVAKKDYGGFLDMLQIPRQDMVNFVIEELKYQELPADQKAAIDERRKLEQDYEIQTMQNKTLQDRMNQVIKAQVESELTFELSKPDNSKIIEAFDARAGKPGAFREEVVRRGQYYEGVLKQYVSPGQVVQELVNLIGAQATTQQGTSFPQGTQPGQAQVQQQAEKPVITAFGSGSSSKSPVRRVAQSIDDLRKLKEERQAQA